MLHFSETTCLCSSFSETHFAGQHIESLLNRSLLVLGCVSPLQAGDFDICPNTSNELLPACCGASWLGTKLRRNQDCRRKKEENPGFSTTFPGHFPCFQESPSFSPEVFPAFGRESPGVSDGRCHDSPLRRTCAW